MFCAPASPHCRSTSSGRRSPVQRTCTACASGAPKTSLGPAKPHTLAQRQDCALHCETRSELSAKTAHHEPRTHTLSAKTAPRETRTLSHRQNSALHSTAGS
eukprot:2990235-Rhodomonas_salina.2